jgi:hypothetical protein
MEKKKEDKEQNNKFTYDSDAGLTLLSEEEYVNIFNKEKVEKSEKNTLKGGKGDNYSIEEIAKKHKTTAKHIKDQLKIGIEVEMEHTDDPKVALSICMDHLVESPDYYTKLKEMEESFEEEKK